MIDQVLLSRRQTLAGIAAVGTAMAISSSAGAATPGAGMVDRAKRWLKLLTEENAAHARFEMNGARWRNWGFMYGSRVAPGLPLEVMSDEEKDAALDLLDTGLSPDGFETALNIMLQQDILRDEWGKGSADRNRERFSVMIFGTPGEGIWGWRWEGHHLSLSYALDSEEVISVTPSSFSSEPNTVPSGPHKGLVVLPDEETLGRAVEADLIDSQRREARVNDQSFGNILGLAGREDRFGAPQGVALGDLPGSVQDRLLRLLEVYTTDHLPTALADAQRARVREVDPLTTRFGWAGENKEGQSIYYRLHSDTVLIEFATLRNQPQHHHAVRHDLTRNLGAHRL